MTTNLNEVLEKVERAYVGLSETARLVLAAAATTRLERQHPLAVILVGGSSSGKTSLLMPLTRGKKESDLARSVIRLDDFTPASLVSHSSNRKSEELDKIDLLPQLDKKCVILKEMAPIFSGKEEDLTRKFAVLASILDGEGYVSTSGSHGKRGYTDPIPFTLLGAVTPQVLTRKVFDSMSAIGPRFCFWDMPKRTIRPGSWRGANEEHRKREAEANMAVITYLDGLFGSVGAGSVPRSHFAFSEESKQLLSHSAWLMSNLRSNVIQDLSEFGDKRESVQVAQESPERAYRYLEQVVMASALLEGRNDVCQVDLRLALKIAVGSGHPARKEMIRILMDGSSPRSNQDFQVRAGMSDETVSKYLLLLRNMEIIKQVGDGRAYTWDLAEPFDDLRSKVWEQTKPPSPALQSDCCSKPSDLTEFSFEDAPR